MTPTGTATNNGVTKAVGFSLLKNGARLMVFQQSTGGYVWPIYPMGTPILINSPGVYTIVPTASTTETTFVGWYYSAGNFTITYPNIYTSSYTFTYNSVLPLAVDVNHTQGFLCKGASPGQGKIFVAGMNGVPFTSAPSPHYHYSLAAAGNGATGPYIANNNTGIFTNFGGNANAQYDVKVEGAPAAPLWCSR